MINNIVIKEKKQGHEQTLVILRDQRDNEPQNPWAFLKAKSRKLADAYDVLTKRYRADVEQGVLGYYSEEDGMHYPETIWVEDYKYAETGVKKPGQPKAKKTSKPLAGNRTDEDLKRYYEAKQHKVFNCCTGLEFGIADKTEDMRLTKAYFCQQPLCPICAKRRSEKYANQLVKMIRAMEAQGSYSYIALTLTMKNVPLADLWGANKRILKAFSDKLRQRVAFKNISKGWVRSLEVTVNWKEQTAHPHLHVIVAVDPAYIRKKADYLEHWDWVRLWKDCLGMGKLLESEKTQEQLNEEREMEMYDPWVYVQKVFKGDIRRVRKTEMSFAHRNRLTDYRHVISEITKYTCKVTDYIVPWHNKKARKKFEEKLGRKLESKKEADQLTADMVHYLDDGLSNVQRVGFGGMFAVLRKALKLTDKGDKDDSLLTLDSDEEESNERKTLRFYFKYSGHYGEYILERMYLYKSKYNKVELSIDSYEDIVAKYMLRGAG